MLLKSFSVLFYSIENNKTLQCAILDNATAREICNIYNVSYREKDGNLYKFLSFLRDRYGSSLSSVFEEQLEEYEKLPKMRAEEYEGLISYLLSLYREKLIQTFLGKYHYSSVDEEGAEKLLKEMEQLVSEIKKMEVSLAPKVIQVGERIDDVIHQVKDKMANPGISGISTGYESLDKLLNGFQPGDLIYIGGRPSHGKTTLALNISERLASVGIPVLFFSKEMAYGKLVRRLLALMSGIPFRSIVTGEGLDKEQMEKFIRAAHRLKSLPIYIDEDFSRGLYGIIKTAEKMIHEFGIKVIFLDYIQLLAERNADSTHELGRISRELKLLANRMGVTVVSISQLNRKLEAREDKRPTLADLRQAGSLEEDADIVMFCYRDELYNKEKSNFKGLLEVIVAKNRDGDVGSVFLNFDAPRLRVYED